MKYRKNRQKALFLSAGMLLGLYSLSGCARVVEETEQKNITSLGAESTKEVEIMVQDQAEDSGLEMKYHAGTLTEEEYLAYANELAAVNRMKESRDCLEECYRLYDRKEAYELLQDMVINTEEETEEIREKTGTLISLLQAGEKESEVIGELMSEDWFSLMMPKLHEGYRNYYANQYGDFAYISVGYTDDLKKIAKLWFVHNDSELSYFEYSDSQIKEFHTGISNGQFQGEFHSVICDGLYGDVYCEKGTSQDGLLTGEYEASCYLGEGETDLFALYGNYRSLEPVRYLGFFENGEATVEQDAKFVEQKETEESTIYAYDEANKHYLYSSGNIFDRDFLGWSSVPDFQRYEPLVKEPDAEQEASVTGGLSESEAAETKVRVYDGMVQFFDGRVWNSIGTVEELVKQDPFYHETQEQSSTVNEETMEAPELRESMIRERVTEHMGEVSTRKPGSTSQSGTHTSSQSGSTSSQSGTHTSSQSGSTSSQPGSQTTTKPSNPEPPQPSNPEPTQPSNPEPAQPSNPEPPQPSNPEPAQPSNPEPAQPSNPEPAQPSNPEPPQPSNPEPTQPSDPNPGDSGSDNGGGSSGDNSGGSGGDNGGDTDIGWSDDLL